MADNYLEKQRDDYEARKAAWQRSKRFGKKKSHPSAVQSSKSKQPKG